MRVFGNLSKYCEIANTSEIEVMRGFEESARMPLERSDPGLLGREVLSAILAQALKRNV